MINLPDCPDPRIRAIWRFKSTINIVSHSVASFNFLANIMVSSLFFQGLREILPGVRVKTTSQKHERLILSDIMFA